ncbi:hypothetical protein K458DRAFT_437129 [Lentithecium fluviatile CBS 122367]|uniref:HCP-like protein n=1 Tax=Lentithecium fluviatile CBS 122367 TaxID=1168545 RepID=A0A6G1IF15_9PLEO|nr:hypothetical protein K458DRAFT_437129 [Lentithecium fluviatile CBS 122367]
MSLLPAICRPAKPVLRAGSCVFCYFRASQPVRRYAVPRGYAVRKAVQSRKTPQELRIDTDKRNRSAFFRLMKMEALLPLGPLQADELIDDFLAAHKDRVDPATNVRQLAKKYKRLVGDITYIAIPLLQVPDVKNPNARLPPSQHPMIASRLLLALSAAKDSLATLQILAAVYHSSNDGIRPARDIARLFSAAEVNECKEMMEKLAEEGDTAAMTLHGQFLERAGQTGPAKYWYERAVEKCDTTFDPKYPHPMALPREQPWIALADLMLSENTPEARAKAKAALEKGALEIGDPLAYYKLASFENGMTPNWHTYMNKAAASGHLEATYKLGHYYMDVNADPASFLNNSQLKKALKFATSWRPGSVQTLAKEWFRIAASGGHKPAMMELAEMSKSEGDEEGAKNWLRNITGPPRAGHTEEWPKLVEEASRRLAGLRIARPKPA